MSGGDTDTIFTDTFGNAYYQLMKQDGYYKYRIIYHDTNSTFVGYLTESLQPLKGVYHTDNKQIEGLWSIGDNQHKPLPNLDAHYIMMFCLNGEDVIYDGKISDDMQMHGEGDLYFSSRDIHYRGTWWKDTPSQKPFKIYKDIEHTINFIYQGQIDECYDLHGHGKQYFVPGHATMSLDTIFYYGKPLQGREARIQYRNGDLYRGSINKDGLPHGRGILIRKAHHKKYIGEWKDGLNLSVKYLVHPNILYRTRLDDEHNERLDGTYQNLSSGTVFASHTVSKMNGLDMLAAVSMEI